MSTEQMIPQNVIEEFLNGSDPEKYIVGVEYDYRTNMIFKIIQDPDKGKIIKEDKLIPFLWVGDISKFNFYGGSRAKQNAAITKHGIILEKLQTHGNERLENGQTHMVKSLKTYTNLINFFKEGGIDPWGDEFKSSFQILNPVEQFLVQKKKRLFKGLDEYDDVHRLVFDIETTGLDPRVNSIFLIGLKDNRGFHKTFYAHDEEGERNCIRNFFQSIRELMPSIIGGYNSAFFDFPFIVKRAEILGLNIKEMTDYLHPRGMKEKEGMLKLANEVETYTQHSIWGFNIIDIAHGVRRAQAINSDIKRWSLKYITQFIEKEKPNRVYVEGDKIGKIYASGDQYYMNPKTGRYRLVGSRGTENLMNRFPGAYEIWGGDKVVEQYLDDDLYETMVVDDSFSQSTFLLSKLVPTTYERISTMGTATLWKIIMLAWSYENNLAIPSKAEKTSITGGLSRLLNVGYSKNVVKFDYSSLYPSIQLVYDIFPECDVMGVQKSMLKYFRDIRIMYKDLAGELKDSDPEKSESYDRKQLPIKIFINAYFGSLSAPHVFPWGDMSKGEMITCTGRQSLRMMIMFFMKKGYRPLVMDTDGVNFEYPEDVNERRYTGKGLNGLVKEGKIYEGVTADVAEFNDIFMRNEMGLDIDYFAPSCINISRKNYAIIIIKKGKEKMKLTGNTIKSKTLPTYISDFLDVSIKLLLAGKGSEFLECYNELVGKIYNKEMPLAKIASKSRVKMSVNDYKKHIQKTNKAGALMSRQAHMELIIQDDVNAGLGDMIYYVNNGLKKSSGDVTKVTKPSKKYQAEFLEKNGYPLPKDFIEINCYMIPEKEIQENPDMLGDYNVQKYIEVLNKRIKPLLCVFKPEIRDEILITDPDERVYFTKTQTELVNGFPLEAKGQDSLNEVLTLSDSEVKFWKRNNLDPFHLYLEDSIKEVDESWVEFNRSIMAEVNESVKNDSDDLLTKYNDDSDVVYHFDIV